MATHPPLQMGTATVIGDGLRTSLVHLQQENPHAETLSNPDKERHIRNLFKDRIISCPAFCSLLGAIQDFNTSISRENKVLLIDRKTQFLDLHRTAQEDLEKYLSNDRTSHSKRTQIWRNVKSGLERFCKCVHRYSSVMDVLSSAHPEIASLAWGAMKFLLAVSVNHQELREKVVNHFTDIGEQFNIVDSYIRLFPEAEMVEHVCGVYNQFATFLKLSIEWCRENALVKFFKNVALPYEARIKPTIDELNKFMRRIKERVDVHNTHRIASMQYSLSALIDILDERNKLQVDAHAIIGPFLKGITSDQKRLLDMAVERTKDTPAADTKLHPKAASAMLISQFQDLSAVPNQLRQFAIQSMQLEVRTSYIGLNLLERPEVKAWLESDNSSLLWIDGFAYPRASKWTTEFSVDVLLAAEQRRSTTLFYFGDAATNNSSEPTVSYLPSPKAMIHSFIIQLLRRHENLVALRSEWMTPERWAQVRSNTKAAWNFLLSLLQSLSPSRTIVYFLLDSIDALFIAKSASHGLSSFLTHLSTLVKSSYSKDSVGDSDYPAIKVLLTSVTGKAYSILFPPDAQTDAASHFIAHVPHTFGHQNVPFPPRHLRKLKHKRLVRLPDSDDEFGYKAADSFEISDDEAEDLVFSSDEEDSTVDDQKTTREEGQRNVEIEMQGTRGQKSVPQSKGKSRRRVSDSSDELQFSENESPGVGYRKHLKDDLEFSSSEEET